jgi:hypothetical protein
MDIGTVAIHLSHGTPLVSRCEEAPNGLRFVPATNAAELVDEARRVLALQGVDLSEDGLYLCPDHLIAAAQLPPLSLPADAITFGAARAILYPDVSPNTGWQRVRRDAAAGHLRVYRIGNGLDVTRYVSRAQVMQLAQERAANTAA